MCFWGALSTNIDAGQVALFAGVGTLLGLGMGGANQIRTGSNTVDRKEQSTFNYPKPNLEAPVIPLLKQ